MRAVLLSIHSHTVFSSFCIWTRKQSGERPMEEKGSGKRPFSNIKVEKVV